MKLPNWFKITWWFLLTAVLTAFLYHRYPDLVAGQAAAADIIVFVIWVALLLAPLFAEVTLLGITLKQELDDLKGFVSSQVADIRNEVRNAVDIRATFSPHFTLPAPPPDTQLPDLEARIKSALAAELSAHNIGPVSVSSPLVAPEDVTFLFAARYNIERELRRIAGDRQVVSGIESLLRRPPTIFQITRHLSEAELIEPRLAHAIREVYSVCSPAIHGEPVTPAQVSFVREVAPELVATLRAIQ